MLLYKVLYFEYYHYLIIIIHILSFIIAPAYSNIEVGFFVCVLTGRLGTLPTFENEFSVIMNMIKEQDNRHQANNDYFLDGRSICGPLM